MLRACLSLASANRIWPGTGISFSPTTSTAIEGNASRTRFPRGSTRTRTLPALASSTKGSPDAEHAVVDQDGGDRTQRTVEAGFKHRGPGRAGQSGLRRLQVGGEQDQLQQLLHALSGQGRNLNAGNVAAELFDLQAGVGQGGQGPHDVGRFQVDLVDRDDDLDIGGQGVADRVPGFGHDPVVGGHDQDHDVGDSGAAGPHLRERGVARGVDER